MADQSGGRRIDCGAGQEMVSDVAVEDLERMWPEDTPLLNKPSQLLAQFSLSSLPINKLLIFC